MSYFDDYLKKKEEEEKKKKQGINRSGVIIPTSLSKPKEKPVEVNPVKIGTQGSEPKQKPTKDITTSKAQTNNLNEFDLYLQEKKKQNKYKQDTVGNENNNKEQSGLFSKIKTGVMDFLGINKESIPKEKVDYSLNNNKHIDPIQAFIGPKIAKDNKQLMVLLEDNYNKRKLELEKEKPSTEKISKLGNNIVQIENAINSDNIIDKQKVGAKFATSRFLQSLSSGGAYVITGLLDYLTKEKEGNSQSYALLKLAKEGKLDNLESDNNVNLLNFYKTPDDVKQLLKENEPKLGEGKPLVTREWSKKLKKWAGETAPTNPNLGDQLVSGVGSMSAFVIAGLSTEGGSFSTIIPTLIESSGEAGNVYETNRKNGMSISEASSLADKTYYTNLILGYITNKAGILSEEARSIVKRVVYASTFEGIQEATQQLISNVATGVDDVLTGVPESFFIASILGGAFSPLFEGTQQDSEMKMKVVKSYLEELVKSKPNLGYKEDLPLGKVEEIPINTEKYDGLTEAKAVVKPDGTGTIDVKFNSEESGLKQGPEVIQEAETLLLDKGVDIAQVDIFDSAVEFWSKQGYTPIEGTLTKGGTLKMEKPLIPITKKTTVEDLAKAGRKSIYTNKDLIQVVKNKKPKNVVDELNTTYANINALPLPRQGKTRVFNSGNLNNIDQVGDIRDVTNNLESHFSYRSANESVTVLDVDTSKIEVSKDSNKANLGYYKVKEGETLTPQDVVFFKQQGETPQVSNTSEDVVENNTNSKQTIDSFVKSKEDELKQVYSKNKDKVDEALYHVYVEMDIAQKGHRVFTDDEVIGINSTFPEWIPELLRSRKLFNKVLGGLTSIETLTYPKGNRTKQRELYNIVLDEVDSEVGIDTSNIRDDIIKAYENKQTSKKVKTNKEEVNTGFGGGKESTGNKEVKYYQGGPKNKLSISPEGVYLAPYTTDGQNYSRAYRAKSGGGGNVKEVTTPANLNIFDFSNKEHRNLLKSKLSQEEFNSYEKASRGGQLSWALRPSEEIFKDLGFDGVKLFERPAGNKAFNKKGNLEDLKGDVVSTLVFDPKNVSINDKTNIIKNEEQVKELKGKENTAPSGTATSGTFADISSIDRILDNKGIKSVEFPELVGLAEELSGMKVKLNSRLSSANGVFKGTGGIELNPKIFENTYQASRTLAHEVGHLADWLPNFTLKRGNLIGRIATLNSYLNDMYGDPLFSNKGALYEPTIKKELKALTQLWKPFDDTQNLQYTKYRYSSKELYADAISVLFNDPHLLKQEAPTFWKGFFEYMDAKPVVKQTFFDTWALLNRGENEVLSERQKIIREGFKKAEEEYAIKREEEQKYRGEMLFRLKYELIDKNQRIIDKWNEAKKRGDLVNEEDNPVYLLNAYNYVGGKIKYFLDKNINPILKELQDNDLTVDDIGELLLLDRIEFERTDIANPYGFYSSETTAKEKEFIKEKTGVDYESLDVTKQIDFLKNQLGEDKFKKLESITNKFRKSYRDIFDTAFTRGELYTEDLYNSLKDNDKYATFQVLGYIKNYVPSKIYSQKGTLKEVANPFTSTTMKMISTLRATERNKTIRGVVDFMKTHFGDEVQIADSTFDGKQRHFIDPEDPNLKLTIVMEKGKPEGYYLDKYIAQSLEFMPTEIGSSVLEILRFVNSEWFRPVFTGLNLGFATFNLERDFWRYWTNVPTATLFNTMDRYIKALPDAKKRGWGQASDLISEMENKEILSVTFQDFRRGKTSEDTQLESILKKSGFGDSPQKTRSFLKPFVKTLTFIENVNNTIEALPKVAGYMELKNQMSEQELAEFIRTSVGSPDFLKSGANKWSNEVALFSNAVVQGMRSDIEVAFHNPKTRSGYWYKTALKTFLPKTIVFLALKGLFGDRLKEAYEKMSEYDLSNYINVPLGTDKNNRVIQLRIPEDESSRLLGNIYWRLLKIAGNGELKGKDLASLFDTFGGQVPSVTPAISVPYTLVEYFSGRNPYDRFRGRYILPETEYKAGYKYSWKPMALWTFKSLGGSQILGASITEGYGTDKDGRLQKTLQLPILSNIIGRWLKVTDYGKTEQARQVKEKIAVSDAQKRLKERKLVNNYVKEYKKGSQNISNKLRLENKLVKDTLKLQPKDADKETIKRKETNVRKKFRVGILRNEVSTELDSLIDSNTNAQKIELLKVYKKDLTDNEYQNLLRVARQNKIISDTVLRKIK